MSFIGAYMKGSDAFKGGLALSDNPYQKLLENCSESQQWQHKEEKDWWDIGFNDAKVLSEPDKL